GLRWLSGHGRLGEVGYQLVCGLEILVASLPEEEGELAGEVIEGDGFFFGEVAVVVIDLEEDWVARGGGILEGGDEFAGLPGDNARVVPAGDAHDGGIFHAGADVS